MTGEDWYKVGNETRELVGRVFDWLFVRLVGVGLARLWWYWCWCGGGSALCTRGDVCALQYTARGGTTTAGPAFALLSLIWKQKTNTLTLTNVTKT